MKYLIIGILCCVTKLATASDLTNIDSLKNYSQNIAVEKAVVLERMKYEFLETQSFSDEMNASLELISDPVSFLSSAQADLSKLPYPRAKVLIYSLDQITD